MLFFRVQSYFFLGFVLVNALWLLDDMFVVNFRYIGIEMVLKLKGFMDEDIL